MGSEALRGREDFNKPEFMTLTTAMHRLQRSQISIAHNWPINQLRRSGTMRKYIHRWILYSVRDNDATPTRLHPNARTFY